MNPAKIYQLPFSDFIGNINHLFRPVPGNLWLYLSKGVSLRSKVVRDPFKVSGQNLPMEVLFLGQLDLIQQPHVRLDTFPGHLHFAHPESSPFVYGKIDVNPLFIIGNLRTSHPDIHKTMIQVEGGNHIRVNFQLVPLENPRFSEPEKTTSFRSQDNIFEVII